MVGVLENRESLSTSEKILMVEELWDEVAQFGDQWAVPECHKSELALRKEQVKANPGTLYTWDQIVSEVQG